MSEGLRVAPSVARRRQYLLLSAIVALIGAAALVSVSLTDKREPDVAARPKSTEILAPGAQVDPRDAWRGQADAQLRAIEQKSREVSQRNAELESQNKSMLERLKKLEQSGLTPLPPPPLSAPAIRPNLGPDRLPADVPDGGVGPQRLPPPLPRATSSPPLPSPNASPVANPVVAPGTGIVSIVLSDGTPARSGKNVADSSKPGNASARDARRYIPGGAFARAVLLGGLDAPTGGQAQRNPQPVLLRIVDNAVLPNQFRASVRECFVVGAGFGDISSERAYIRTESLSCVTRDGTAIDMPIKGYVAGEDGKAGMRGRLVSKQGQLLANALVAGVASGIGHAFQQGSTTFSVSPLGSTSTLDPGKQLEAGLGSGVGKALDRLAQYYISLAEKVFPVIEIDAGRTVDVVVTQGVSLGGALDSATSERAAYPYLAQRSLQPKRTEDDDDE